MTSVYKTPRVRLFGSDLTKAAETARPDEDWSSARRSQPLNRILPATQRWAEGLSEAANPDDLLQAFPRIANQIAHVWHDPAAAAALLDDLLIDRRGGRKGFPPPVLFELMSLRSMVDGGHSLRLRRAATTAFRR